MMPPYGGRSDDPFSRGGVVGRYPARDPAGDGDVRARRRHVADERLDLGGGARPRYDRQRGAVRDRARGTRVRRVHPDRQQDRRPHRAQTRVRPRSAGLRGRGAGDDARAGPDGRHHLLGDHRGARRVAPATGHAVPGPRQLRRGGAAEGLRARRRLGGDRRSGRAAARWLHHDVPVVARGVRARGRDHRGRPAQHQAGARCAVHGRSPRRPDRCRPVGVGHGRHRARHPRVAGGRRGRRRAAADRRDRHGPAGHLARAAQAERQARADRPDPVRLQDLPAGDHRTRCSSRSRWAA